MAHEIQELREFRARAEPEMERLAKKQDEHSGKLGNVNVELAELRVDLQSFKGQVLAAVSSSRWWIMASIAALGLVLRFMGDK